MISLDLRDLRKNNIYCVRVYGKEFIKVSNKDKLKAVKKALNILGIEDKFIHVYRVNIRKVYDYV